MSFEGTLELGSDPAKPKQRKEKDLLPVLKGYMLKQDSNIFHTWSENWFVLERDQLFYYKTERDLEHQGFIDLCKIQEIKLGPGAKEAWQFSIVTPDRTFYLQSGSERERKFWIYGLKAWMQHFGFLPKEVKKKPRRSQSTQSLYASSPSEIGKRVTRRETTYVARNELSPLQQSVSVEDLRGAKVPSKGSQPNTEISERTNGHGGENGHAEEIPTRRPHVGLTKSMSVAASLPSISTTSPMRRGGKLHSKLGIVDDLSIEGRARAELLSNRKLLQTYADEINIHTKKRGELEGIVEEQTKELERLRKAVTDYEEREKIREQIIGEQEKQAKEMITSLKLSLAGGSESPVASSSSLPMTIGSPSKGRAGSWSGALSSSPPISSHFDTLHQLRRIEENLELELSVYKEELKIKDEKLEALSKVQQEMKKSVEENQALKKRALYFERLLDDKLRSATEEGKEKDKEVDRLRELLWAALTADLKIPAEKGAVLLRKAVREGVKEEDWKEWAAAVLDAGLETTEGNGAT